MQPFLQSTAQYLHSRYPDDYQDICLVFPNRRAGVFFSRYLAKYTGNKPVWLPPIRTIADLMQEMSGLQPADPLTLVFQLYQVYKQEKKSTETFDEFYYWGEMLLNDFDDIDKYLVEAKQIFTNLADLKEIENQFTLPEEQLEIIREFWTNIKLNEASALKDDFISVWQVLTSIYTSYHELLQRKGLAYEGMMCRKVAESLKDTNNLSLPYKRFAIIGFNALNKCEKEFFKYLQKHNLADFFWDFDPYYTDNVWHEGGLFIRENRVMFPPPLDFSFESGLLNAKSIEVVSIPSDVGQAKAIASIIDRWNPKAEDMTNTAVVLADEQLLIPVLSSIPKHLGEVNVTLGYSFRYTPVYSFFENLVALHRNVRKSSDGQIRYYYRDVLSLLNHPYVQSIMGEEATGIASYIVKYNRILVSDSEFESNDYLKTLFQSSETSVEFIDYLTNTGAATARLLANSPMNDAQSGFHQEYWLTFITSLNRLKDIIVSQGITLEQPILIKIIRKLTAGLSIPFKGEPLAGLQVMGVLETRNLDFTNLIILSVNEGVLPKSDASASFIPYNLRRGFDLPTIEHQDSVYAYYFYRLLQRAQNVALLYNSQGGGRSGEMSRFIYQLKYEKPPFNIVEKGATYNISLSEEKDICIEKSESVMQSLSRFTDKAETPRMLTPTALNAWLQCSLKFYFRYIAGIKEKEDVSEDIEGSMFGKLLHYAMERLYAQYVDKTLTDNDFKELLKNEAFIDECIMKAFAVEYFHKEHETPRLHGKSLVVKEVLRKYIRRILEVDRKYAPLTPLEFEKTVSTYITVNVNDNSFNIYLGGNIDRIDKTLTSFRVIDYKTGKVDRNFNEMSLIFEPQGAKLNKEALQIMLYASVLSTETAYKALPVETGLYGMREMFDSKFDYRLYMGKTAVENIAMVNAEYMNELQALLKNIFDSTQNFVKTSDKATCEYCEYRGICHR